MRVLLLTALTATCSIPLGCNSAEPDGDAADTSDAPDGGGGSGDGECSETATRCAGVCTDLASDTLHCGDCDTACTAGQSCVEGQCGSLEPPAETCEPPLEAVDTSAPDHVVGDGTPESCTFDALKTAVGAGGIIAFDCGGPAVIDVTEALQLPLAVDTVVDGGGEIVLDGGRGGGRKTRIFEFQGTDYRVNPTTVVLQGLTMQNAEAPAEDFTPQQSDPKCAWGYKDGQGGAIYFRDGALHVIDCVFQNNRAASPGPDTGGGAIYALGARELVVSGSSFIGNQGSNGGAVGLLQTDGVFYNSQFKDNQATGNGQNFGGATGCPTFNHAEQGGAGGNSAAVGIDGQSVERVEFCGVLFQDNSANELGTVSRTPNSQRGKSSFDRVTFLDNHAGDGGGAIWMQDMEFELTNSTIAGNTSDGNGGGVRIDQGPHGSTIRIENTTFSANVTHAGLGGGLVFAGQGSIRNCTFANNEADGGEGYFGAAIVAQGPGFEQLSVDNTIFWNNLTNHEWTPMTCSIDNPGTPGVLPGENNMQWPTERVGSNSQADNPCTANIAFQDAELSELSDNGGPTATMLPGADASLLSVGQDCPATDQRGQPRPASGCTIGAVEQE
ncbi:MAG TPA: choice-of-anchor Q domain-containing protein [Polyangiaceae bacterium]|nr:choice-of-anchor Q domain-containing protein [Polyangiaceae bacterium]